MPDNYNIINDNLDDSQIQKVIYDKDKIAQRVLTVSNLVPEDYDEIGLAYIASGPGVGEIGLVTYKKETVTVAVLQLEYDSQNRLTTVKRI